MKHFIRCNRGKKSTFRKYKKKEVKEMEKEVKLSPPWITFFHEVECMFMYDPAVIVQYNDEEKELKLLVEGALKADAISQLMPDHVDFGNVTLKVSVIPANDRKASNLELIQAAFAGNGILKYTKAIQTPFGTTNHAVFSKEIAQFYNDDMQDIHGVKSMLYADIAKDIFKVDDVFFNTDSCIPVEGW